MEKIYSITEVTNLIKRRLEGDFPAVWVEGEVSNAVLNNASGHIYFDLKDKNAKLPAVMFRSDAASLKFRIENGLKLHCFGRITIFAPQGKYQIIVNFARPAGLGELLLIFEQLKDKLSREGLFDESLKRPLPFLPRRIGIVTSREGAAIRDMLRIIHERFPARVLLYPALVQGASAAKEIISGIEALNGVEDVDVIIIGRGGGSFEDLFAFCDEALARAVRASRVPVISAVGHEIDYTLADFAADVRAPTPTAAAGMVVPEISDLRKALAQGLDTIVVSFGRCLDDSRQNLDNRRENLLDAFSEVIAEKKSLINTLSQRLKSLHPAERLRRNVERMESIEARMLSAFGNLLKSCSMRLEKISSQLRALSPRNALGRGYSIVMKTGGRVIKKKTEVSAGDDLHVILHEGEVDCVVK